jgi:hypothetical protein
MPWFQYLLQKSCQLGKIKNNTRAACSLDVRDRVDFLTGEIGLNRLGGSANSLYL